MLYGGVKDSYLHLDVGYNKLLQQATVLSKASMLTSAEAVAVCRENCCRERGFWGVSTSWLYIMKLSRHKIACMIILDCDLPGCLSYKILEAGVQPQQQHCGSQSLRGPLAG